MFENVVSTPASPLSGLYASAYSNCGPRKRPFPEDFQRLFADPNDMDLLSADQDTYTLVVVPCIILLLASKVVVDQSGNLPASEEELASLQKALSPFWQPGLPLNSLGLIELATVLATARWPSQVFSVRSAFHCNPRP